MMRFLNGLNQASTRVETLANDLTPLQDRLIRSDVLGESFTAERKSTPVLSWARGWHQAGHRAE